MSVLIKYPRTPHLPWSEGATNDDKVLDNIEHFNGKRVVVSLKMDGENTSIYNDHIHARSLDSKDHESRHYIKALHARIKYGIPNDVRICGENLFARHSIPYKNLPDYFLVFSLWEQNTCLSWDETCSIIELFDIKLVPVFISGVFGKDITKESIHKEFLGKYGGHEGYVIRSYDGFEFEQFGNNVAKYVRKNHVQTEDHWMFKKAIPNKLSETYSDDWFLPENCIE